MQTIKSPGPIDVDTTALLKNVWGSHSHRVDAGNNPEAAAVRELNGWDPRKQRPSSAGAPAILNSDSRWSPDPLAANAASWGLNQNRSSFPAEPRNSSTPFPQPPTSYRNAESSHEHANTLPSVPSSGSFMNQNRGGALQKSLPRLEPKLAVPTTSREYLSAATHQRVPVITHQGASFNKSHSTKYKPDLKSRQPIATHLRKIERPGVPSDLNGVRSANPNSQGPSFDASNTAQSHAKATTAPRVTNAHAILPRPDNHHQNSTAQGASKHSAGKLLPSSTNISSNKRDANGLPKADGFVAKSPALHSAPHYAPQSSNNIQPTERRNIEASEATGVSPFNKYVPSNWDPSLPREVIQVLQAMRRIVVSNGAPNRAGLKKWADGTLPGTNYFVGDGTLGRKSPLWDFTLDQLGLSPEAWRYLNRADKPLRFPGQAMRAEVTSRPSTSLQPLPSKGVASANSAPLLQTRSSGLDSPKDSTLLSNAVPAPSGSQGYVQRGGRGEDTAQESSIVQRIPMPQKTMDAKTTDLLAAVQNFAAGRDMHGVPWDASEDDLLIQLKEVVGLTWPQIGPYFSHRLTHWSGCQVRYSSKLSRRNLPPASRRSLSSLDSLDGQSDTQSEAETASFNAAKPRKSSRLEQTNAASRTYRPIEYFQKVFRGIEREQEGSDDDVTTIQSTRVVRRDTNNVSTPDLRVNTAPPSTSTSFIPIFQSCTTARKATLENDRYHSALSGGMLKIAREPAPRTNGGLIPRHMQRSRLVKRRSISIDRPYLSANERRYIQESTDLATWDAAEASRWQDAVLHADFTAAELEELMGCTYDVCTNDSRLPIGVNERTPAHRIAMLLLTESRSSHISLTALCRKVSWEAIHTGVLNRTRQSIESFLQDQCAGVQGTAKVSKTTNSTLRIDTRIKQSSVHRNLRYRECGISRPHVSLTSTKKAVFDTLGPLLCFTGTSSDVNTVAWSSDGKTFAAGSAALTDSHSMQYNRPRNLLLGDTESRALRELPHHATQRPLTEHGANSTRAMYASQDPVLYQSVSAVAFSTKGTAMVSVGYDNTMRIYDVRSGVSNAYLRYAFTHRAPIDLLAVSERGLFATGCARDKDAIRVFRDDLDTDNASSLPVAKYCSPRAREHPDQKIMPTSLKWGHTLYAQSRYLLCGFSAQGDEFRDGEVCVWDVESSQPLITNLGSRNIFDVAWSPSTFGRFAVARTPGEHVNRGSRSVVQLFDSRADANSLQVSSQRTTELECPALDVNDVVFNPTDDYLISVGCTDSSTYMWDLRKPDQVLHRLAHSLPLLELDQHRLEEVDTGIRYLSWDATERSLITGSSDGIVAKWNPYRAPEDAFERTIAQLKSGVMSGAFNADFSNLLLGEVNGTISVLALGRDDDDDHFEDFMLEANPEDIRDVHKALGTQQAAPENDGGIAASKELLASRAIQIRQFGDFPRKQAVQGDLYRGPYDNGPDAAKLRQNAEERQNSVRPSANQCQLEHEMPCMTEEGQGDNKASELRIPESFRSLPLRERANHIEKHMICFRCKYPLRFASSGSLGSDVLDCSSCKAAWRMDLLGYTLLNTEGEAYTYSSPTKWTDGFAQNQAGSVSIEDLFVDMEDATETEGSQSELQGFEDYIHSFWLDRPPSPL